MELWYTEKHTPNAGLTLKTEKTLYSARSRYQQIDIVETPEYGRMLLLDGLVMITARDEFVYHEMLTHVPLCTHPNARRVLIIGGGDGGTVREAARHSHLESIVQVEIDGDVVEACREFFPEVSATLFSDPRVKLIIGDGIQFAKDNAASFDVVLVDSTDPIGPAVGLVSEDFYRDVYRCLAPDGLLVAQSESPFYHREIIIDMYRRLAAVFPIVTMYLAFIPTYPSGLWSFAVASKKYDPRRDFQAALFSKLPSGLKYYNADLHRAALSLPNFVKAMLEQAGVKA